MIMEPWKIISRIMEGDETVTSEDVVDIPGPDNALIIIYVLIMLKVALIVFAVICCRRRRGRPSRLMMKWA
ncbi:TPA_asm: P6 [Cardamine alphacytorhabdovirus 1]|nr:TPA_asm: P6 [Cardamine alphacytorhabdovirus 1]